jgi:transcriptional regulator with XRE-family HTH domain
MMISSTLQRSLDRIAIAIGEQRAELGISQRQLADLVGIDRGTIAKAERGGRVRADLLLRIGGTLMMLEIYTAPPAPEPVAELSAELSRFVVDRNGEAVREMDEAAA